MFKAGDLLFFRFFIMKKNINVFTTCDFYGAKYLFGVESFSSVSWVHGWKYNEPLNIRGLLDPIEELCSHHLVWTDRQRQIFLEEGITSVTSVGSPYLYVLNQKNNYPYENFTPCDILVMPPHSYGKSIERKGLDEFLNCVKDSHSSEKIRVCLFEIDFRNKEILNKCHSLGFEVVCGADVRGRHTLARMRELFFSAKKMITSTFGSHIVYAIASGCQVDIYEDFYIEYQIDEYKTHPYFKDNLWRANQEYNIEISQMSILKEKYSFLFEGEALNLRSWALKELGEDSILSPDKLRNIFLQRSGLSYRSHYLSKKIIKRMYLKFGAEHA